MEYKDIKLERLRNIPYSVNYVNNGKLESYHWQGIKGNIRSITPVPEDVVTWLLTATTCFKDGELKIINDNEIEEKIPEIDEYKNNTNSKQDIIDLLSGNFKKMESVLNKITVTNEKHFVIDVAKEIGLDSAAKQKWLAEWVNVPQDILFADDEE